MSAEPAPARRAQGLGRIGVAWRGLGGEQRRAALAALGLFVSMFLPWYSSSRPVAVRGKAQLVHDSHSAIGVFSWVEAAVLLIACAVLAMLFARGERRAFHLPGGDGTIILGAGGWAFVLIVWRLFDKPDLGREVSVGVEWGIFFALLAAGILAWTGARVRAAHRPEPPLRPRQPEPPPGAPVEVHIPEERPHLDQTEVMPGREPPTEEAEAPTPERPTPARPDPSDQQHLPGMG